MRKGELYNKIKQKEINYIVIHKRRNFLSKYFKSNKNFKLVKEFNNGVIKIFEVIDIKNNSRIGDENNKILVTSRLIEYLRRTKIADNERFKWYADIYFKKYVGLDENIIEELINYNKDIYLKNILLVNVNKIY